jgi:hypothetical protein
MYDLTSKRYNRLVLQWPVGRVRRDLYWLSLCDCGIVKPVRVSDVRREKIKSCGCWNIEKIKDHGHTPRGVDGRPTKTREYNSWSAMKMRVLNPNHVSFHNYGGRGITICSQWLNSFSTFLKDMGLRPPKTYLERKNNNKGYSPDNCVWASMSVQQRNKRRA